MSSETESVNNQTEGGGEMTVKSWSRSPSSVIRIEHIWIIENFSLLSQNTGEALWSPIFSDLSEKKVEWKLQLFPKGEEVKSKGFISLFLWLNNPKQDYDFKLIVSVKLILQNKKQTVLEQFNGTMQFDVINNLGLGFEKFLNLNKLTPATLPEDELHVKCEIMYAVEQTSLSGSSSISLPLLSSSGSLIGHFKNLIDTKTLTDLVIQVQEEKFDAHKIILSARSSVFLAMFQSDLTEKQTNTVKIEDIEPAVFKEVLRFIYTDQVENMDELAEGLLAAAERYMLELLKEKCASHLATKITVENCAHLLLLADLHSAAVLKTFVLDFFRSRAAEVAQTASWQQLMQSANPLLFRDISVALIPKKSDPTQQPAASQ